MCMYVSNPVDEGTPYVVHPTPADAATGYRYQTSQTANTVYANCVNTCPGHPDRLSNGVCDDGGVGAVSNVCSPGTDCADCGARQTSQVRLSDQQVGTDLTQALPDGSVYMDNIFAIGAPGSGYSKTPMIGLLSKGVVEKGITSGNHFFGYASCQWLRHANNGEFVGAPCSATLSNVVYNGYIFMSDTGSYECGRLTALDNEYGEKPIAFDKAISPTVMPSANGAAPVIFPSSPGESGTAYRCPTGSPAKGMGTYVSPRLLIAGCMISSDPSYSYIADVHVPAYCNATRDYRKGCMNPAALNYNPAAVQSDHCQFPTLGCMNTNAVNYNPEATVNDGSCIARVVGCTVSVASYVGGGNIDTPGYRSLRFGANVRAQFARPFNGPQVVESMSSANSMRGVDGPGECRVSIEGCTDPAAVNYDPLANINTGTWCVPRVTGCMLPPDGRRSMVTGKETHFSTGWDVTATVHNVTACKGRPTTAGYAPFTKPLTGVRVVRYGCMDPLAANFDAAATVSHTGEFYKCYETVTGCLNPLALNFGCNAKGTVRCTGTSAPATPVTVHNPFKCTYPNEQGVSATGQAPPAPPAPSPSPMAPVPEGSTVLTVVRHVVEVSMAVSGTADYLLSSKCLFVAAYNTFAPPSLQFSCDLAYFKDGTGSRLVSPPSASGRRLQQSAVYNLQMELEVASPAAAAAATSSITSFQAANPPTVDAFMAAAAAKGVDPAQVEILSAPIARPRAVSVVVVCPGDPLCPGPPVKEEENNNGAIIGGVIGGVAGLMLVGGGAYMYMQQRKKTVNVVPA